VDEVQQVKDFSGGLTPVEYLNDIGFLGPDFVAAHAVVLTDNDIRRLAETQTNVIHNQSPI
jgi:cytosine/adenosine deaminase-related metal-dependent hydrolase